MRWTPGGESSNIEDRRGASGVGRTGMGLGGAAVLLVLSLVFGHSFFADVGATPGRSSVVAPSASSYRPTATLACGPTRLSNATCSTPATSTRH